MDIVGYRSVCILDFGELMVSRVSAGMAKGIFEDEWIVNAWYATNVAKNATSFGVISAEIASLVKKFRVSKVFRSSSFLKLRSNKKPMQMSVSI